MAKSVVSIAKNENVDQLVHEALEALGGVTKLFKPNATIVIKPNSISGYDPKRGITTDPEFVGAVIRELQKADPKEIIMGESSAMGRDSYDAMRMSGLVDVAQANGVTHIIDFKAETDLIDVPIPDPQSAVKHLKFPRVLLEADYVINLPHMKSHVTAVFSGALKNIKGTITDQAHLAMHQTNLAKAIADAWKVMPMYLTIADAIRPLEGFGPLGGIPHDGVNCVVAGKDPVAVDATLCRMFNIPIDQAPLIQPAIDCGIGVADEESIEIVGRSIEECRTDLWIPYLEEINYPEYDIRKEGSCSSCQGLLQYGMERLKSLGLYEKNAGVTIILGARNEVPEGKDPKDVIIMGDCAKRHKDKGVFCPGCPPLEMEPCWSIADREYNSGMPECWKRDYEAEVDVFHDYLKDFLAKREAEKEAE